MSALERLCNYTLYSPLQNRIGDTHSWLSVLISLEIITAIAASVPLYLYFRLDCASRAKLWPRFLPFFFLLLIGAISGVAGWASYMNYLVALQVTTSEGAPPLEYPYPPDPQSQPMSAWWSKSFLNLVPYFIFFPIEFSCFTASQMFVLERLLTFGTSSMGHASSSRAHLIFKWLLAALCVMFAVITVASWTSASFAAPFSRRGLGLNLYDKSDKNDSAIESGLDKLFVATAILFFVFALALVTAAFGCALFCFYCFRRIQLVSFALAHSRSMPTAKAQAVEATIRKTRVLIMSTSVVVAISLIVRAGFQVLYGIAFTASYKVELCSYQCQQGCQDDLFLLQVFAPSVYRPSTVYSLVLCLHFTHQMLCSRCARPNTLFQAILRYSPVFVTVTYGVFQCVACIFAAWAMVFNQRSVLLQPSGSSSQKQGLLQTGSAIDSAL
jgi:hypothetical protein